jgi:hypothetical protein
MRAVTAPGIVTSVWLAAGYDHLSPEGAGAFRPLDTHNLAFVEAALPNVVGVRAEGAVICQLSAWLRRPRPRLDGFC